MPKLDTLLFQVFERLRKQGVLLGVSDYLEAIETIQAGVGLEDSASFNGLCRLLWAKSREDQELFDLAFAELVEPQLQISSIPEPTPSSKPPSTPSTAPPQPTPNQPEPQPQPEPEEELEPQQVRVTLPSRSVGHSFELKSELTEKPHYYQLTPRLPISPRDMAGIWRQLHRPQRVGVPEELDVEGTINSICRSGLLLRPLLRPRRRNQARLVVLVDQQGSMAPFAPLIEAAIESILRGGLLSKTSLYYFHDCPEGLLYQRPSLTAALPLEAVLDEQAKGNSVLIISDAGAARGYYDRIRVADTKAFLKTLTAYTYLHAWLNPMPQTRWKATTAEDIACMVPMFPLDREGLNDAVNILRGHPFPGGVGIDE
jgi:uncharacterized protein with von Willebrand factor type A (vWA) domain